MITLFFYLRQLKRTKVRVLKLVITFSVGRFYIYLVLYDITFKVKRIFKSQTKVVNIRIESFIFQQKETYSSKQLAFNSTIYPTVVDVSLATSLHIVISANHLMVAPNTVKPFSDRHCQISRPLLSSYVIKLPLYGARLKESHNLRWTPLSATKRKLY